MSQNVKTSLSKSAKNKEEQKKELVIEEDIASGELSDTSSENSDKENLTKNEGTVDVEKRHGEHVDDDDEDDGEEDEDEKVEKADGKSQIIKGKKLVTAKIKKIPKPKAVSNVKVDFTKIKKSFNRKENTLFAINSPMFDPSKDLPKWIYETYWPKIAARPKVLNPVTGQMEHKLTYIETEIMKHDSLKPWIFLMAELSESVIKGVSGHSVFIKYKDQSGNLHQKTIQIGHKLKKKIFYYTEGGTEDYSRQAYRRITPEKNNFLRPEWWELKIYFGSTRSVIENFNEAVYCLERDFNAKEKSPNKYLNNLAVHLGKELDHKL